MIHERHQALKYRPGVRDADNRAGARDLASPRPWLDLAAIVGLLVVAVIVPLILSAIAGASDIPRNDDWSYRRIALDFARSGRLVLDRITETMLIGQILLTQPLLAVAGQASWAFSVAGVTFGAAGIMAAYALGRTFLPPPLALFAASVLAVFPGYLAYATSYMTDVPALAAQLLCLAIGAKAILSKPIRLSLLVASVIVGLFGFSIREFALAAPAAVLLAALIANPRNLRLWALGAATVAFCAAIHVWRSGLPGQMPSVGPGLGSYEYPVLALASVSLVMSPVAMVGAVLLRSRLRRSDLLIGAAIGVGLLIARVVSWTINASQPRITLENLASPFGAPASVYLPGGRPLLFSPEAWVFINGWALVATVIVLAVGGGVAGMHLRGEGPWSGRLRSLLGSPIGLLGIYCVAVVLGLSIFGLSRPVFDRYFWPLVTPLAVIFLYRPWRGLSRDAGRDGVEAFLATGAIASFAFLCVASVMLMLNSFAFDSARWESGEQLEKLGLSPSEIDAGYEWVGFNATTEFDPYSGVRGDTFYAGWWPRMIRCGIVSSSDVPPLGGRAVGAVNYKLNLIVGPEETLYLYVIPAPSCPSSA
jgi:hypothetical protein